jgi:hypothetical protein
MLKIQQKLELTYFGFKVLLFFATKYSLNILLDIFFPYHHDERDTGVRSRLHLWFSVHVRQPLMVPWVTYPTPLPKVIGFIPGVYSP